MAKREILFRARADAPRSACHVQNHRLGRRQRLGQQRLGQQGVEQTAARGGGSVEARLQLVAQDQVLLGFMALDTR
jgi:hypothetical protein